MKSLFLLKIISISMIFFYTKELYHNSSKRNMHYQNIPTVEEVQNFFSNQKLLITYREGEVVYGTYFFLEIHYCPNGYGLYGKSVKQTVLGNEQISNWQDFGTWKVIENNGLVGLYYASTSGKVDFVPIYKLPNGDMFIKQGVSIVKQGPAICN